MTDDDHPWLPDDLLVLNTVCLVAASAFAIALTSCIWHHLRPSVDDAPSILSAALASLHITAPCTVPSANQQQQSLSSPDTEQGDRKSTRSKERRRRGKNPFRDLFKGGKKSKAVLKAIKTDDHDNTLPSADTLSNSSAPLNDTASSTSRSQSPEPAGDLLEIDRHLGAESDGGSARSMIPNGDTSSTSAFSSASDISDQGSSDACSQTDGVRTHSVTLDSTTVTDVEPNVRTIKEHAFQEASSSPPTPTACGDTHMPQPRNSQAAPTGGSCVGLVRARTRLRLSRMDTGIKSSLLSSTPASLLDNVASPSNSIAPCSSLSIVPSTHPTDVAGPSTPTNSLESTPPPRSLSPSEDSSQSEANTQPLNQSTASAQIQLASMRSALEAARLREEELRIQAEKASKERDELRWGWNENAGVWRGREAELQAQIHHLMQQLQAYAAIASFQAQQASSGFSSPTSPHAHMSPRLQHHPLVPFPLPPAIQAQNSASAPAHVQALLAYTPTLTSHSPGFAAPLGGLYSGAGLGTSPMWSGLGLCVPNQDARHGGRQTPDSSASGSSPRGRRRRRRAENAKSTSDDSSLGDWDGMEDGSGDEDAWEEEEEDIFRNNVLADAILKRPESIRGLSSVGKRSGMGLAPSSGRPPMHGGVGERMDALKDPALEQPGFVPPFVDTPAIRLDSQ